MDSYSFCAGIFSVLAAEGLVAGVYYFSKSVPRFNQRMSANVDAGNLTVIGEKIARRGQESKLVTGSVGGMGCNLISDEPSEVKTKW